ncbi:phage tail tube protein [Metabacillus bambusae]|uniref:Capsid protein n=1 Tax=Metabacillus bambusae TaxID=2795218 RepID=A0ABS3NC15_9BACI|nr:capsid protein [Metabacillus bambusae]MBO1515605.1 capsid protein [Metabacillus bambusae]
MSFELMNSHAFKINTVPGTTPGTLVAIAAGITNVEPANNEGLDQTQYLDGEGFTETDVINAQMVLAFTGHRKYGDAAQDFIFGKLLELGTGRRTDFEWTEPDGGIFTGDCTIANISGPSGAAGAKGEISFEIHFNGKPTYTPPVVV